jgi:hypothetical protein
MKITVKPKVENTDQFNISLPQSLKQRLQTLRTEAPNHGADFNSTLVGIMEEFATELEIQWGIADKSPRPTPRRSLEHPTPSTEPSAYGNGRDKD